MNTKIFAIEGSFQNFNNLRNSDTTSYHLNLVNLLNSQACLVKCLLDGAGDLIENMLGSILQFFPLKVGLQSDVVEKFWDLDAGHLVGGEDLLNLDNLFLEASAGSDVFSDINFSFSFFHGVELFG